MELGIAEGNLPSKFPIRNNLPIIITTGRKPDKEDFALAEATAKKLNAVVVNRGKSSIRSIAEKFNVKSVIVVKNKSLVIENISDDPESENGTLFFHPSLAHVRLKNLRLGQSDHLIDALAIKEGDSVIDCTLGLGADSIVISYAVGASGKITSLEINPLISAVVSYGLAHYSEENNDAAIAALRRINVVNADYLDYLKKLPEKSVDCIYFDPMFRFGREKSVALHPLRHLADPRPLKEEAIKEACRVARRRVVMKENWFSKEFSRLGFSKFTGGKYSQVRYGIIKLTDY